MQKLLSIINKDEKIKCAGIRGHDRDYVHPSCALIDLKIFRHLRLSFVSNWGKGRDLGNTEWDTAEKVSMDLLKHGYKIDFIDEDHPSVLGFGHTYGNIIYHNFYAATGDHRNVFEAEKHK